MGDFQTQLKIVKSKEIFLMKSDLKMHLVLFSYEEYIKIITLTLDLFKTAYFFTKINKLIISIHLSQVKHTSLKECVYLACLKLIRSVQLRATTLTIL